MEFGLGSAQVAAICLMSVIFFQELILVHQNDERVANARHIIFPSIFWISYDFMEEFCALFNLRFCWRLDVRQNTYSTSR